MQRDELSRERADTGISAVAAYQASSRQPVRLRESYGGQVASEGWRTGRDETANWTIVVTTLR
jgi:uncharacterized membrane protein